MAKSNFIVRGGADFSGLYKGMNTAQKRMSGFQAGISKTLKGIGAVIGTLAIGKLVKDSTSAAMGVESSMNQISRIMGSNSTTFNNWAQTQAKAFGIAREEAFKYGSTYGNLISTFTSGTEETTRKTTELLKASAIVASATGRTMEDTMERIRSGLLGNTESIEDLGINVNVAMLESTEAFKKFANGKSWQKLTFQEQQQIRLMSILEQANTKYGDSLAGTTATKQMMFLATLKNIRLNIGQAFLPIYNVILPALTSLASKLEYVTSVFASFSQALFGKATKVQANATEAQATAVGDLGDATEAAGKQAKGALAGFDEINSIDLSSTSDSTDVTGTAIADSGLVNTDDGTGGMMEGVSTKASEMATKIKEAFTNMKNAVVENKNIILPAIGGIVGALAGLAAFTALTGIINAFKNLGTVVKGVWTMLAANPVMLVFVAIGLLVGALVTAYQTNDVFRTKVDALWSTIKTNLSPVFEKLKTVLTNIWSNVLIPLGDFLSGVFAIAWQGIGYSINIIWNNILVPFGNFLLWLWKSVLSPLAAIVEDVLGVAFSIFGEIAKSIWNNVLKPLASFFSTVLKESIQGLIDVFSVLGVSLSQTFKPIIESLISVFQFLWYNVLKPLIEFMWSNFKPAFDTIMTGIKDTIDGLKTTFVGLINFIAGTFTGDWKRVWEGIKTVFRGVFDTLYGFVKVPLNLIILSINKMIDGLNKIKIDIPDWVSKITGISGTWGFNISNIPALANGGITNGPTLAMVGDNPGGREVVSPLDDLTNIIASAVGTAVMNAMQFSNSGDSGNNEVIMTIDGTKFARIVLPKINNEAERMGFKPVLQRA